MRTAVAAGLVLALALPACNRRVGPPPEAFAAMREIEVRTTPEAVLDEGVASLEPSFRARALRWRAATDPAPAAGEWGPRGLFDPDPWVQRQVAEALLDRLPEDATADLLADWLARDTVDPYVRGSVGFHWMQRTGATADPLDGAWTVGPTWERAPLALPAAALGDPEAIETVAAALKRGEVALEPTFLHDIGRSGRREWIEPLREGDDWVEPEMQLPFAAARLRLGDPSGEGPLRDALSASEEERRLEALDLLVTLPQPEAEQLLRRARGLGPDMVREYATLGLAARGAADVDRLTRAMDGEDPELRMLAVQLAADAASPRLGDASRRATRIAEKVVKMGLVDEDPDVRAAALRAAAELELVSLLPLVRGNLMDEFLAVRIEAAGATTVLERARE